MVSIKCAICEGWMHSTSIEVKPDTIVICEECMNNKGAVLKVITKDKLTKKDVLWGTYSNQDDSATLHHCLYDMVRVGKYDSAKRVVNAALCNRKHRVYDGSEIPVPISELGIANHLNRNGACKTCLKIYDKLPE